MNIFFKILIVSSFFSFLVSCKGASIMPDIRVLTKEVEITNQWKNIAPTPPLQACKKIQYISINVEDIEKWDINSKTNHFITPVGKTIQLEIKLIDENKKEYIFNELNLGSGGIGMSYLPENKEKEIGLPHGVNFISVNIRSTTTIKGSEVTWRCVENY